MRNPADAMAKSPGAETLAPDTVPMIRNREADGSRNQASVLPGLRSRTPAEDTPWVAQPRALLGAFRDAAASAALEAGSTALDRVLWRGGAGQLVATDGVQLLAQSGFRCPWTEDLLVARSGLALAGKLLVEHPVQLSRARGHVVLRAGPWEVALRSDRPDRFPSMGALLQRPVEETRWRLAPVAAARLARVLARDGSRLVSTVVVLDLGRPASVWVQRPNGTWRRWLAHPTRVWGSSLVVTVQHTYLSRALALGFRDFRFTGATQPVWARDRSRMFLWMPCTWD